MAPQAVMLPAEPASVPQARRFVRETLTALRAGAACDVVESLVSELATNAVLHARTPFTVEVSRAEDVLRVCVHDASPVPVRMRAYGTESTTGRGLRLVASQAADWGVEAQRPGKIVWFEVPADGGAQGVVSWDAEIDVDALLASYDDDDPQDDGPEHQRTNSADSGSLAHCAGAERALARVR